MLFTSLLISCPPDAALPDIPVADCAENFGQIQKLIFQRTKDGTTINTIAVASSGVLLTYSALKSAVDSTKIVVTPFISAPTSSDGGAREFGGGNETLNGIPIILGENPSPFECKLNNAKQEVAEALKKLMGESQGQGISVFLVNEHGQIAGSADSNTSPTTIKGFPIQGLFVGSKVFGGYDGVDSNMIKWSFKANWSDTFYVVTPTDFDALSQL